MRNLKLLLLPVLGFLLFFGGLLLPLSYLTLRLILMIGGALVTLVFYFISFSYAMKSFPYDYSKRIFWLIAIICVPVIGNIIYILFMEMANRRQKPRSVW